MVNFFTRLSFFTSWKFANLVLVSNFWNSGFIFTWNWFWFSPVLNLVRYQSVWGVERIGGFILDLFWFGMGWRFANLTLFTFQFWEFDDLFWLVTSNWLEIYQFNFLWCPILRIWRLILIENWLEICHFDFGF